MTKDCNYCGYFSLNRTIQELKCITIVLDLGETFATLNRTIQELKLLA